MSTLAASVPTAAISLYFREGSSDKVYHAQIVPNGDDLYAVNFQYGRRGSTLQTGAKTAVPVALAEARKIFNKLVTEKKAKGYTEGERGVPYSGGELANRRFEYTPQLLNFIDEHAMLEYLLRPDWFMQKRWTALARSSSAVPVLFRRETAMASPSRSPPPSPRLGWQAGDALPNVRAVADPARDRQQHPD